MDIKKYILGSLFPIRLNSDNSVGLVSSLINFPATYVVIRWFLLIIYVRSSFFHIVEGSYGGFYVVYLSSATFLFLIDSIYIHLNGTSKRLSKEVLQSTAFPLFVLFKMNQFYNSGVREENVYIRLSYWMIFAIVSFFSFLLFILLIVFLANSPLTALLVILQFLLIGPSLLLVRLIAKMFSGYTSPLSTGYFKKSVTIVFAILNSFLILWFHL